MPRVALSQIEVEEFRDTLCAYATRLFAEQGYEGVTMRALANGLGCSPMTPYRYFENKAEIFDAVRSVAWDRFAIALERSIEDLTEHPARLHALARAYVQFGLDEPYAYRIMFELDQDQSPETQREEDRRSWNVMYGAVGDAVAKGDVHGEPNVIAHLLWSGMHGLVALHLSGMLRLGLELEALVDAFIDRELSRPSMPTATPQNFLGK